jgi:dCMP deaminase
MYSRPSIHLYYLRMLELVASRSTCRRRKVAAILTTENGKLISIGYNGVPRGLTHCIDSPCEGETDQSGDNSKCLAIHAEQNAIIQAESRIKEASYLYCSTTPCFNCSKLIISAGIKNVVCASIYPDKMGIRILVRAGIGILVPSREDHPNNVDIVRISQTILDQMMED